MIERTSYGIKTRVRLDYEAAIVKVAAMDPDAALGIVENPGIKSTAKEVTSRLERVIGAMAG